MSDVALKLSCLNPDNPNETIGEWCYKHHLVIADGGMTWAEMASALIDLRPDLGVVTDKMCARAVKLYRAATGADWPDPRGRKAVKQDPSIPIWFVKSQKVNAEAERTRMDAESKALLEQVRVRREKPRNNVFDFYTAWLQSELKPVLASQPPIQVASLKYGYAGLNYDPNGIEVSIPITDVHFGEVSHPGRTLGLGGYDYHTAAARVRCIVEEALAYLRSCPFKIKAVHLLFLGDNVHNELMRVSAYGKMDVTLAHQMAIATAVFRWAILRVAEEYPVTATFMYGNHGRIGSVGEQPDSLNIDLMIGEAVKQQLYVAGAFEKPGRVKVNVVTAPQFLIQLDGVNLFIEHGHGGPKFAGDPVKKMKRRVDVYHSAVVPMLARITEMYGDAQTIGMCGHYHSEMQIVDYNARAIILPSVIGVSEYGMSCGLVSRPEASVFLHTVDAPVLDQHRIPLGHITPETARPLEPLKGLISEDTLEVISLDEARIRDKNSGVDWRMDCRSPRDEESPT